MCKKQILSVALLLSTTLLQAADNSGGGGWMSWFWRKKNTPEVVSATQQVDQAEPSVNQLQPVPRAIVEADLTLEFGDNAFAFYDFDGRDNKLTCCYMDGEIAGPLYVEYPTDETKSYEIKDRGRLPAYGFDDSTTLRNMPGTDLQLCKRFVWEDSSHASTEDSHVSFHSQFVEFRQNWSPAKAMKLGAFLTAAKKTNSHEKVAYQAFKCEREKVVWMSSLINFPALLTMHDRLPYFAVGEKNLITVYNRAIFTDGAPVEPLATISVNQYEFESPQFAWHPTENKLLVVTDLTDQQHMIAEYNGDLKKIEKQFPLPKNMWPHVGQQRSAYVPATKQIVMLGAPAGKMSKLYELRENAEPRQLPIEFVGKTDKEIVYRKIINVTSKYLVLECVFSDNPRFLGVCDLVQNKLYNVHNFRTENGSIVFDPATFKLFEMGHRVYFGYPDKCEVYNRECSILKLELPE
jgi:hypothetical protein